MVNNYVHIAVRTDTKTLIMTKCVEEYLKHHPEFEKINITSDKILFEMAQYYLKP